MPPEVRLGTVKLVGAGPGAADLLTLRAARVIESAQALLYDALISQEVLALAPAACLKIQTGKRAGRTSMKQETINRLMLRLARRGVDVVRLKGGDPSIFGRVGEEQAFLHAHGVATEVVPGITAASAAAAQFGFPLTHRRESRRLLICTATAAGGGAFDIGGKAAEADTTLAIYMGRDQVHEIARQLIRDGRPASTPAAAVENAGHPDARALWGTLEDLPGLLDAARPSGPVLLLIGDVTARATAASPIYDLKPQRSAMS
jgi:uroporphyrin-III C-methyltransferase